MVLLKAAPFVLQILLSVFGAGNCEYKKAESVGDVLRLFGVLSHKTCLKGRLLAEAYFLYFGFLDFKQVHTVRREIKNGSEDITSEYFFSYKL